MTMEIMLALIFVWGIAGWLTSILTLRAQDRLLVKQKLEYLTFLTEVREMITLVSNQADYERNRI